MRDRPTNLGSGFGVMAVPTGVIKLRVSGGGKTHDIEMKSDDTIGAIKLALEGLSGVSVGYMKLLSRGKPLPEDQLTLAGAGIRDRTKLMLMFSEVLCSLGWKERARGGLV